jgi:hypothetical protein
MSLFLVDLMLLSTAVSIEHRSMESHGPLTSIHLGSFHEPKTFTHKIQKALMLETDVPETINEMLVSVRKMGKCGIIAAYAGFANGVNVGALMEKGVR